MPSRRPSVNVIAARLDATIRCYPLIKKDLRQSTGIATAVRILFFDNSLTTNPIVGRAGGMNEKLPRHARRKCRAGVD